VVANITVSSISNRQCIHRKKPSLLQPDFILRTRPLIYNVHKKQLIGEREPCLKPIVVFIIAKPNIIITSVYKLAIAKTIKYQASEFNQTIDERLSGNSVVRF